MSALLDITVKTLDGQNRSFSVPEEMTVRSFKEKISSSIQIPADTQRLIFHGRVMQDEKVLREYDIHGKAVHVVQRAPPSASSGNTDEARTPNPPPPPGHIHAPDGSLLDVQIHFGGMNTAATPRDARQRIQQAEVNVGIIHNALNLLEQRLGLDPSESTLPEYLQEPSSTPTTSSATSATTDSTATTTNTATTQENMDTSADQRESTTSGAEGQRSSGQSASSQSRNSQEGLSAAELAAFMDRVLTTSRRMEPHITMYRNYLTAEETYTPPATSARDVQEVANRVMEAVHAMSHVMHNLSDVMVDWQTASPRQATAAPQSPFSMTGTNTMAIPIHMNVRARPSDGNGGTRGRSRSAQRPADASGPQPSQESSDSNPPPPAPQAPPAATVEGIQVQLEEPVMTLHNIQATVVTDDVLMDGGMHFDMGIPPASTSISVVSAQNPAPPASSIARSSASTATSTTSGSARTTATSNPSPATAGFSVGPTTNVNIGGTAGLSQLPNVPGLPGGMLQNIVQSILNNHGVQPGQPVQVNVLHPAIHIQQGSVPLPGQHGGRTTSTSQQQPSTGTNTTGNTNTTTSSGTGTGAGSNQPTGGSNSRSGNTPRPIFINRGGRPAPYPMGPRHATPRPPGHHHGNGGGRHYVDPFVPCTSHHYLSQTARRAARAARNQGQQQQQQQVPNLSTMVSGMVGDLFGQVGHAHQRARNNAARSTTSSSSANPSGANSSTASSTTNTQTSNSQSTGGMNPGAPGFNPMQMFANLMGGPGGGVQAAPGGPGGPVHLDLTSLIANMMGGGMNAPGSTPATNTSSQSPATATTTASTGSGAPPGNPMGGTLADLFRQFTSHMGSDGENDQSEPSFVQSLIETVAPHVRLTDLFSLVMGNTRVIGQLRQPLQEFVRGRQTQLGSMEAVVNSAVDDMDSEIAFITNCVEVRPGVDMSQSLRNCLRFHLQAVLEAIMSDSPASQEVYGRELYHLWMVLMAEVVALCIYCIRDGETGFASMLQQYMPRMTRDLNPAITIWMSTSVQDILTSFHRNHPVPEADVIRFVAHTQQASTQSVIDKPASTDTSSNTTAMQGGSVATQAKPEPEAMADHSTTTPDSRPHVADTNIPMEVNESPSSQPPKAKVQRTQQVKKDSQNQSDDEFVDAPEEFTSRPPPTASAAVRPSQIATSSSSPVTEGMKNGGTSSQWQSVIPEEWIPVINQDMERQNGQRPQPPFSDAYLQGLPAKRRRMMVLEHAGEIGNMPQYLPSAIARAARVAGVEPISSEHNLMQEASEDTELHEELEQEVQNVVESRITSDSDFNSDRFPNSIRYFQKPEQP